MDIKGPGPIKPPHVPPSADGGSSPSQSRFPRLDNSPGAAGEVDNLAARAAVRAEFRKADLMKPAMVDRMVRLSVEELVAGEPAYSQLTAPQRDAVIGWMEKDPVIRGKICAFLERVLD